LKNFLRFLTCAIAISSVPLVSAQEGADTQSSSQQSSQPQPSTHPQPSTQPQTSSQQDPNQARRERIIQLLKKRRQMRGGQAEGAQNSDGTGNSMSTSRNGLGGGNGSGPGAGRFGLGGSRFGRGGPGSSGEASTNQGATSGDQSLLDADGPAEANALGNSNATARDIAYGKDPLQKLDVYAPQKGTAKGPVILFAHGGGWRRGDKKTHGMKGAAFSSNGVLFISTNYRLAPDGMHPKEIQDIASAFAWVKAHARDYGADPDQIYVMGHSAGAHLVDLLSTNDKFLAEKGLHLTDIKGCISLDTASLDLTNRSDLPGFASKMVADMVTKAFGTDKDVLTEASPLLQLKKGTTYPPFLMICSANRRDSMAAHQAFEKAVHDCGGTVTTKMVPLNHGQISQAAGNTKTAVFAACLAFVQGKPVAK
jgi:arylformamidase